MMLREFANLCETLEHVKPTEKAIRINQALSLLEDKSQLIKILTCDFPNNNIGSKKAIKWVASALELFEEEVEYEIKQWGDIGAAVHDLYDEYEPSPITLKQFIHLLELDCSQSQGNNFALFKSSLNVMSGLERKWFLRYWVRKPRNGIRNSVVSKAIGSHFTTSKMKEYELYHSLTDICAYLQEGVTPPAKLAHGQFISPMLAKARKGKQQPNKYIIDIKYDGNRYQIHKSWISQANAESILIFNRKGNIVTNQFPDVVEEVSKWDGNFIIDTEIYPINMDGSPAEHKLMAKRVHKLNKTEAVQECPVKMVVFDLLSFGGEALITRPLQERVKMLQEHIPSENQALIFDENTTIEAAYNVAINEGFEGIMIKSATASYKAGKRSVDWLKYKPPRIELDVVITSARYGEGKRANVFGTYGISILDGDDYISIGKVGTGLSDTDLWRLTNQLKRNVESFDDGKFTFLPRVVLEVSADLVSQDEQGNYGLRFPRVNKIREDKFPKEINTLNDVMEMI